MDYFNDVLTLRFWNDMREDNSWHIFHFGVINSDQSES